jgi:thiosulfate/3-mercaptopyruvate sulfurtransferase
MNSILSPLIDAQSLHDILQDDPLLLDWRFDLSDATAGRRAFAQGHVSGAHYVHLDEVCGPKNAPDGRFCGRHPLPDREDFARHLTELGWQPGRRVVCYDAGNSMFAARGWWMLLWLGETEVQVLDGGLAAWQIADFPLSRLPTAQPFAPLAHPTRPSLVETVDAPTLRSQLTQVGLIDARAPERFRGEVEPLDARAGHIPGAINRPYAHNLQADGRFKPAAQLREEWLALQPTTDTVHQCGSGVTACHNLLALAVAGLPVGRLYPGSWSEWSADPSNALAVG